ncbi:TPA: hypothetical protein OT801_000597 [Morganella morganii]|nr:hypothetical protein [Morganella morganii]HCT7721710.1 hypothetical protein [Morganella morganii]
MKNDELTIEQKLAVANIAKDLVITVLNNKLINNAPILDAKNKPGWQAGSVDGLYNCLYDNIINKIKA